MPALRPATLFVTLTLVACGPRPEDPAASTGPDTAPSSTTDAPTTSAATDGSSTGGSTSSTTGTPTTSTTATDSTGSAADDENMLCNSSICGESEHCTPEARINADITGTTPLGPFTGTFAFASAAIAFGQLGIVRVIPKYGANICIGAPLLRIQLYPGVSDGDFLVGATISVSDGEGQVAQTTATVQVRDCCQQLGFCSCESPAPYALELDVVGDGWSLTGTARPNCCRSYSVDEGA